MAAVIFLALAVAGGKFLLEEGRSGIDPPQLVITCSSREHLLEVNSDTARRVVINRS
jgi:hypothetical protein